MYFFLSRRKKPNYSSLSSLSLIMGDNTDLPSYKELFPSHPDINNISNDPSSTLPPPSYDDFVKTLAVRPSMTTLPLSSSRPHSLSLPTTSLSTSTNPTQCIWITDDQARGTVSTRGNITYV